MVLNRWLALRKPYVGSLRLLLTGLGETLSSKRNAAKKGDGRIIMAVYAADAGRGAAS
jgi:hypothetical protein